MPSTTTTNGTELDRKSLRRPDGFTQSVRQFFDQVSKKKGVIFGTLAAVLAVVLGVAIFADQRGEKNAEAKDALFQAQLTVEQELQATTPTPANDSKKATPPAEPTSNLFSKPDVAATYPKGIQQLKEVSEKYSGTRAAYEAKLNLGDLYFRHGQPQNSIEWYEAAVKSASDKTDKAFSFYSLAQAQESAGKAEEALKSYDQALNQGHAPLRSELLLGKARAQELAGKTAEAKATYDQIRNEFPNTDYERRASSLKALLD